MATSAAIAEPELVPETYCGNSPSSCKALTAPIWAIPCRPPPEKATPKAFFLSDLSITSPLFVEPVNVTIGFCLYKIVVPVIKFVKAVVSLNQLSVFELSVLLDIVNHLLLVRKA